MITIVEGNILHAKEDIIGHQVNCQGVMGAGLALQIKQKFPFAYKSYIHACQEVENKRDLLGSIRHVRDNGKVIAHLFGQYTYGRVGIHTDYSALKRSLTVLKIRAKNFEETVALPYGIGCGLAGGDWETVYGMIESIFKDYEVTLYKFN